MADRFIKGTPPPVMLPAKNYVFKITDEHFIIRVPRKGKYHDLAPEIFPEDAGEFNIFDEESGILYLPSITKVLFAVSQYPDLKFNQFFTPYSLKFEGEEVVITGQVIDMVLPVREDGTVMKKDEEQPQ